MPLWPRWVKSTAMKWVREDSGDPVSLWMMGGCSEFHSRHPDDIGRRRAKQQSTKNGMTSEEDEKGRRDKELEALHAYLRQKEVLALFFKNKKRKEKGKKRECWTVDKLTHACN